jgi:hypothetical protein
LGFLKEDFFLGFYIYIKGKSMIPRVGPILTPELLFEQT